jgi:hypothetical protein
MTDERIEGPQGQRQEKRREWQKPAVHDMLLGRAEFGGDTSVDGSGLFS